MHPKTAALIIVATAAFVGPLHLFHLTDGFGAWSETSNVARTLVTEGRFANALGPGTGATAQQPPMYPFMLAAVFRVLGFGTATLITMLCLVGGAMVGWLAMLPMLSSRLMGSSAPGLTGALWLISVPTIHLLIAWPEPSIIPLALICFCLLPWSGWRLGAVLGILAHLSPSVLPIAAAWYFSVRRSLRDCLALGVAFVAVCLPWTIRNFHALGGFVPMRSTFGLELYVGNTGAAHPVANAAERAAVIELGELGYMRRCQDRAMAWIKAHPRQFIARTAHKIRLFWFGSLPVGLLSVFSIAGVWLMRDSRFGMFAAVSMLLYPMQFYVASELDFMRYRSPLVWVMALLAGRAITVALSRATGHIPKTQDAVSGEPEADGRCSSSNTRWSRCVRDRRAAHDALTPTTPPYLP